MTRIYKIIEVNIPTFLYGIWAFFYLISDLQTKILIIDNFFAATDRIKLKYLLALVISIYYFVVVTNNGYKFFKKEFRNLLITVGILVVISLYAIVFNSRENNLVEDLFYFLVPIVISFLYINAVDGKIEKVFDVVFYIMLFAFVLRNIKRFSISNILSISILHSYSPYESQLAFTLALLVAYYAWRRNKPKMIISFIMCFLSLKRFCLLFSLFSILFFNRINKKTEVKKIYNCVFIALFMMVPLGIQIISSDSFTIWFSNTFGMDWDQFVLGRFFRMKITLENYTMGGGLGSVKNFTRDYFQAYYNDTKELFDLHCDNVRFYLECYPIGFLSLLVGYIGSAKSFHSLCLMVYIFTECCANHLFGAGSSLYWTVVFFLLFVFNQQVEKRDEESNENESGNYNCAFEKSTQ